ncbi:MAG TPA: glycoside hydrolase family 16 protein [Treponema sp.]|nr:glycoside hydrolase family 16 protein [Treponema sp.]
MTRAGTEWTQKTTEYTVATGDTVTYFFTYEKNGLAYSTAPINWNVNTTTTPTDPTTPTNPAAPGALNTVSIVSTENGSIKFSITLATRKTQVHLFAKKNGLQDYVVIDLHKTGEVQNADGTWTYTSTRVNKYIEGDTVAARFYTYAQAAGQVFYPGPRDSAFTTSTYSNTTTPTDPGTTPTDPGTTPTIPGYTLVWADEFNGSSLDTSKWNYDIGNGDWGWGNGEAQYYRAENVKVSDGILKITAKKENYAGFAYTSGRINTKNKFAPKYGKIEVRAMTPVGSGTWPAFWMLGSNMDSVGWPKCGEVDIMEIFGANSATNLGTVHWFADETGIKCTY